MDLNLNDEQLILKDTIHSFVSREFPEDRVSQLCLQKEFPLDFEKKVTELGLMGTCFPQEYNGADLGPVDLAVVIEELARNSVDLGMSFGINVAGGLAIHNFGTKSQKEFFLPALINGKVTFSFGYYDPCVFSDGKNQNSEMPTPDRNRNNAKITIYSEKRDPDKNYILLPYYKENSSVLLIIPQKTIEKTEQVETLGRDLLGLNKYEISHVDVLKSENTIDHEHVFMSVLNWLKFVNLMSCIGNMDTVINKTITYSMEREQFGKPIGTFQSLQHLIVDARTDADISKQFGYWIAWLVEKHDADFGKIVKEMNMASTFVAQAFVRIVNTGMQVMGGYGYMVEGHMERYIRDARMATCYPEDGFLQKLSIAKEYGIYTKDPNVQSL